MIHFFFLKSVLLKAPLNSKKYLVAISFFDRLSTSYYDRLLSSKIVNSSKCVDLTLYLKNEKRKFIIHLFF